MDALGGYGSDSSSDENQTNKQQKTNSLSALLGDASDSDDDEISLQNNTESLKSPPLKRQRQETEPVTKSHPLPAPPTTSVAGPSVIHWDLDYLAETRINDSVKAVNNKLSQKLETLAATLNTVDSWADRLKTQKEFHNPRFFNSAVEHFGIKKPLDSQAKFANSSLQEYERNIFILNQIQPQQQQH